jgi:molecular chaperone HtpG
MENMSVSDKTSSETLGFQTEVRQLLQLMIHSLYSNKEIFLRELISNASDAADKLRFEALASPDLLSGDSDLKIRVVVDKKANTISVIDNGVGMSREDLIDNLGTIAKSGTADFLQNMTGDDKKDAQLIGQFGVGFYSAFIVADKVVVETKRADLSAAEAVRWESDGQGEFTVDSIERAERGTTVTLFLKETESEFSESLRLDTLIRKYSDHIAFPVQLEETGEDAKEPTTVNSATALWMRSRSDIDDEEYKEFYKYLSHDFSDPIAWSHNRVEGKREYTSLLYVPTQAPYDLWNREAPRGLKLYVQRVFIMDDAEQFLPLYLRFVKGIVDAADLPLNVSRELLQNNPQLAAMKTALTRRVLDMLSKLSAGDSDEDREIYAKFWKEFGQVLKEGLVEDASNADKLHKLLRFTTTNCAADDQDQSLADYVARMVPDQDKIYFLVAENYATAKSSPHLEQLTKSGIEVLLLTDKIDPWLADHLSEFDGKGFQDVGRGQMSLPQGDGVITQETMNEENKPLLKKISKVLKDRIESVVVSQRLTDSPACVVTADKDLTPQLRRMLEASGQQLPESKPALEINIEHALVEKLLSETDDERFGQLSNVLLDHALLAEGTQLDNPGDYVQRMNKLLLDMGATEK